MKESEIEMSENPVSENPVGGCVLCGQPIGDGDYVSGHRVCGVCRRPRVEGLCSEPSLSAIGEFDRVVRWRVAVQLVRDAHEALERAGELMCEVDGVVEGGGGL